MRLLELLSHTQHEHIVFGYEQTVSDVVLRTISISMPFDATHFEYFNDFRLENQKFRCESIQMQELDNFLRVACVSPIYEFPQIQSQFLSPFL